MIYTSHPGVDDDAIADRLDFVGQAREFQSWADVRTSPPIIVGPQLARGPVPEIVRHEAIERGILDRWVSRSQGSAYETFLGEGIVEVGDQWWFVQGTSEHDDRFHEHVSGMVVGYPVARLGSDRTLCLESTLIGNGRIQVAMALAFFTGRQIDHLDEINSGDALEELVSRMASAGWTNLTVVESRLDPELPIFHQTRVDVDCEPVTNHALAMWAESGHQWIGRVPRAGASALENFGMSFPAC